MGPAFLLGFTVEGISVFARNGDARVPKKIVHDPKFIVQCQSDESLLKSDCLFPVALK